MACGAPGRLRGERRHGRARRRRGRDRRPARRLVRRGPAARSPEAIAPTAVDRDPRPTASGTAAAARRRAVERFALADWLDRHAAHLRRARASGRRRADVAAHAPAQRRGVKRRSCQVAAHERGTDPADGPEQHAAGRACAVAVASQHPSDARTVAEPDRPELRTACTAFARASPSGRGRSRCARRTGWRAGRSRPPRPTTTACPTRARGARRRRPTRATTSRRRKIVNEITRFQRFERVEDGRRPRATTDRPTRPGRRPGP